MIVLDLALMLAALYLFWTLLVAAVGFAVILTTTVQDWHRDRREQARRTREDAEVRALDSIPVPGEWERFVA